MIAALLYAAISCASCGSGGDDPLILYPNEDAKVYFGMARTTGFRSVDADGRMSHANGPANKDTLTTAVGKSLGRRAFATATIPYVRNERDGDARSAPGDPSLAARYTAVMQSIATPMVPQVQVVVGYKTGRARSLRDSEDHLLLDVFGSGFAEWRAGVDIWYGQSDVKVGAAHQVALPQARTFSGHEYEPGIVQRSTLSAGYMLMPLWKASIGLNREQRAAFVIDGEEQSGSGQVNHAAFLTSDVQVTPADTVRASWTRQAAVAKNRNTSRSTGLALAYMRSF